MEQPSGANKLTVSEIQKLIDPHDVALCNLFKKPFGDRRIIKVFHQEINRPKKVRSVPNIRKKIVPKLKKLDKILSSDLNIQSQTLMVQSRFGYSIKNDPKKNKLLVDTYSFENLIQPVPFKNYLENPLDQVEDNDQSKQIEFPNYVDLMKQVKLIMFSTYIESLEAVLRRRLVIKYNQVRYGTINYGYIPIMIIPHLTNYLLNSELCGSKYISKSSSENKFYDHLIDAQRILQCFIPLPMKSEVVGIKFQRGSNDIRGNDFPTLQNNDYKQRFTIISSGAVKSMSCDRYEELIFRLNLTDGYLRIEFKLQKYKVYLKEGPLITPDSSKTTYEQNNQDLYNNFTTYEPV